MADIFHDVPINGPASAVFMGVATAQGLATWWANSARGEPAIGAEYALDFGPDYQWRAVVSQLVPEQQFELLMTECDADWLGTRVGFRLTASSPGTILHFHHLGWRQLNDHCRTSSYCWAMYLRCLKHFIERGVVLPYAQRFDG